MDLGAAAEGIGAAYIAMLVLGALAIHLVAVAIASIAPFYGQRLATILASVAVALLVANHVALLVMGDWRGVILGSILWTHCLIAATGWVLLIAIRVYSAPSLVRPAVTYSAAVVMIVLGLCIAFAGLRSQFQSRSNVEDDVSLATGAIGLALIGAGASLPFARGPVVLGVAMVTPYVAYVLSVILYWGTALVWVMLKG